MTSQSCAGTTSVKKTFENIFRREKVQAAYIEGDAFHRYDREDMRKKMVARHPHVFGDVTVETSDDVVATWEKVKAVEKSHRTSVLEGIPQGMPSLALADKTLGRAAKVGVVREAAVIPSTEQELGDELLAIVAAARAAGLDSERALRGALRALQDEVRAAEASAG